MTGALDEISKAITLLYKPGDVIELRVPKAGRLRTISGYFSNQEKLAEALRELSKNEALPGIYLTINPCVASCLSRCAENYKPYAETTTSDSEIARRRRLLIDCDAVRVSGVSSTDEEKAAAGELASRVLKYLNDKGLSGLLFADSGNGWHILVPIDLPNDSESTALCSAFLSALAQKFDTNEAVVDKKTFNASRILKAYGTIARKGSDTRERPHRMSKVVSNGNGQHAPVARELLEEIAAEFKQPPTEEKQSGAAGEMEEFLDWGNIQRGPQMAYKGGLKWQLACPFDETHHAPDAVVYRLPGGAFGFTCSHNSCAGRGWPQFRALVEERKGAKFQFSNGKSATGTTSKQGKCDPWSRAEAMDVFLAGEDGPVDFLFPPLLIKESIAEIFSPRGIGKTMWALFVAVELARKGRKVLLIDRDNPRRAIKARLRSFGATRDLAPLKVISRENAPPLTEARAWEEFPYFEYDLVIVDSLDSAAEGVGEQDSAKPSKAIAPLLDIAHRENGPAVLVLGNCVKTGAHSRGSGVIEDRADIVCEVRDCTSFHPSGKKPWVEELPAADAGSWASRSSRRKKQVKFRLAFIPTKFREGEEPEPFIVELNLAYEPWTVCDVTDLVDLEGKAERERSAQEAADRIERAKIALLDEIYRRVQASEPPLYKDRDAIPFLQKSGLKRNESRQLLRDGDASQWRLITLETEPGKPIAVLPPGYDFDVSGGCYKESGGGKTTPQRPAKNKGFDYPSFRHVLPVLAAEICSSQVVESPRVVGNGFSAAESELTAPRQRVVEPKNSANPDDDEVLL